MQASRNGRDTYQNKFFFLIQFNVPFKIISLISRQANQKVGRNGSTLEKPPDTPASRIWLVSHVASAGLGSGEMIECLRALKFSDLTNSATGAALSE